MAQPQDDRGDDHSRAALPGRIHISANIPFENRIAQAVQTSIVDQPQPRVEFNP